MLVLLRVTLFKQEKVFVPFLFNKGYNRDTSITSLKGQE